jgi:glycosyltransferase involved in cell wall biosynthesis
MEGELLPFVLTENQAYAYKLERMFDGVRPLQQSSKKHPQPTTIVHAPTSPQLKGTKYVIDAVEALGKIHDIDFLLLENLKHDEVLRALARADIAVDQLLGDTYGVFAIEAMAYQLPVITHIIDEVRNQFSVEDPLFSASPDTLEQTLRMLVEDTEMRVLHGKRGKAYVDDVHSPEALLPRVLELYIKAAQRRGRARVCGRIENALVEIRCEMAQPIGELQ